MRRAGSLRGDGAQISNEGAGILPREAEGRHVGMAGGHSLAQALHETVDVEAAVEIAERRRAEMRALSGAADRMTGTAHPFGERRAALGQRRHLGGAGGAAESDADKQRDRGEADHGLCRNSMRPTGAFHVSQIKAVPQSELRQAPSPARHSHEATSPLTANGGLG